MRTIFFGLFLCVGIVMAGCDGPQDAPDLFIPTHTPTPTPPGRTFIALTWTGSWVIGTQSGPIAFPKSEDVATLTISETLAGSPYGQPYSISTDGNCVSITPAETNTATQITAQTSGSCNISVTDAFGNVATIAATVP